MPGPYRAPQPRPSTSLTVRPLLTRWIVALCLVLTLASTSLFLGRWSRVVDVDCSATPRGLLLCDARVESLVQATDYEFGLICNGDTWTDVCNQGSMAAGFGELNLAKVDEAELAGRLSAAVASGSGRVRASFGSRWGAIFVPILCAVGSLLILAMLGLRVKLTVDRDHRLLTVERRHRPERTHTFSIELDRIDDIAIGAEGRRQAVVAKTRNGTIPLFPTVEAARFQPKVRSWFIDQTTDDD